MFASQSISALVIVILCNSHLCLNKQDIDPNSSVLEASRIESGPSKLLPHSIDSVEKSDHNFYSPIVGHKNKSTLISTKDASTKLPVIKKKKKITKNSARCASQRQTFIPPQQLCRLKPDRFLGITNATKIMPNLNTNCDDSSYKGNKTNLGNNITQEQTLNVTSQPNNDSKPNEESHKSDLTTLIRPPAKDMLSFEEWRKKISEQMEVPVLVNKQQDLNVFVPPMREVNIPQSSSVVKLPTNRARNFASHECGAKIVDSNSEADFVNRVLNEQTDEYMLNPCKTKNWFVIELCETIQPQYLELANFELYSSIPKEFTIHASEHYPARNDWSVLGGFTSNDVRNVQGFKLHNNGFVKYLKVELHSYYGSEHFCPISVIRVFGTSLFDEVERIDKPLPIDFTNNDENSVFEESIQPATPGQGQDIFGSAKKAVYNMFLKALNFNIFNKILDNFSINKDSSAAFDVHEQSQVIKIYSSFELYLSQCESFFINSNNHSTINIPSKCIFLRFFFPEQLFESCYTQYFIRKFINYNLMFQCSINGTYSELNSTGLSLLVTNSIQAFNPHLNQRNSNKLILTNLSDKLGHTPSHLNVINTLPSSILPSISLSESILNITLDPSQIQPTLIQTVISTLPLQSTMTISPLDSLTSSSNRNNVTSTVQLETKSEQVQLPSMPAVPSEFESDIQALSSSSGQSKEAVIVRLTNRIKNLEKNISLMSTYLENLSVRYRIQMEEMQLIFNKTIDHLNNTAIRAAEKDAKQQEFILALESEINKLKAKIDIPIDVSSEDWLYIKIHIFLMIFELTLVLFLCLVFYFVFKRISSSLPRNNHVSTNQENHNLVCDERKLIDQSSNQNKKSLYRSKSMSDLREEHFIDRSTSPNGTISPEAKPIGDTDCDNSSSDKENCQNNNQIPRPENYSNSNYIHSNLADLTNDTSAKKILKAVNN